MMEYEDDIQIDDSIDSSAEDIQAFMSSSLYKDFLKVINTGVICLTERLKDTNLTYTLRDYDLFRGGIKNLEEMGDLFPQLLMFKQDELNKQQEGKDNGERI